MRMRIKQARPKNLNEALRHAIELEAFLKTEQRLGGSSSLIRAVEQDTSETVTDALCTVNGTIVELQRSISTITQELKELKERDRKQTTYHKSSRDANWRKDIKCNKSGKRAHMQKDCRSTTVRRTFRGRI
jgi:formiminotetrahydrofolate cyclodeaminase